MNDVPENTEVIAAFEVMAAAYKRQFRLDLNIDTFDNETTIRVSDGGDGDVKYLGTLRSNWLRRNAQRFGFQSIANELYPEVAGGAYRFVDAPQPQVWTHDHTAVLDDQSEVQKLADDPEVHVVTTAEIHSVGLVPEDQTVQEVHVEVADPEEYTEAVESAESYRSRFLD